MTSQEKTLLVKCLVPECKKRSKYGSLYCRDHHESKYATCILCELHDHDQFSVDEYRIVEVGSFIEIEQYIIEHFWENDGENPFGIYMDSIINGKSENPIMFVWTPAKEEYKDGEVNSKDKLCGKYVVFDIDIDGGGAYQYHELKDAKTIYDNKLNAYKKGNKLTDHGYYPILALYQFGDNGEYKIIEDEEIFVTSNEEEDTKEEIKPAIVASNEEEEDKNETKVVARRLTNCQFEQLRKKEYFDKLHSHAAHNHKIQNENDYIYFLCEIHTNSQFDNTCKFVADGSIDKIREYIDITYGEKYIDSFEEVTEDDVICDLLDGYSFELSDDLKINVIVWSPGEYKDGKENSILHGPNIIGEYNPNDEFTMYQYHDTNDVKIMYERIITEYKKGNNLMSADYMVTLLQITFDHTNEYKYSVEYIPVKYVDRECEEI